MAFKSCRRVGALSEIIVSNSFFTFCESICTLIHKLTTIHQKAALLFNIHPCILMGYFSNNAADNNMKACYIPCKIGDPESLAGEHAQTSYTSSLFYLCLHKTHTHVCFLYHGETFHWLLLFPKPNPHTILFAFSLRHYLVFFLIHFPHGDSWLVISDFTILVRTFGSNNAGKTWPTYTSLSLHV